MRILARIPVWNEHDPATPTEVRNALEYTGEQFGENLNVFRVMANHSEIARRYVDLAMISYGKNSTITPAQRELAYTTATVINSCHY